MSAGGASDGATIVAVVTGAVPAGVGLLRISGPAALEVARPLVPDLPSALIPRHAYVSRFVDRGGAVLDEGLCLVFEAPHSFTGEHVVELHAHGSPRLLSLLEQAVLADGRVREAEPGEFTRRAFLNGRLDLARAEAVADLVSAQSEGAVRAAAAQLRGGLSEALVPLKEELLALHADLEGVLNFPDEAEGADDAVAARLAHARGTARALVASAERGRLIRRGARVVLFGPTNSGKSTLFNRLLGEERALVDAEAGTTRDVLEARVELGGLGVTLCDTAGLRAEPGRLEALGIARARAALQGADLALLLVPREARADEVDAWRREAGEVRLLVLLARADEPGSHAVAGLRVSGRTGLGVEALRTLLGAELGGGEAAGILRGVSERHAACLQRSLEAIERAGAAEEHGTLEAVAGEVGLALEALLELTGERASDAVLDAIFKRFCIGK